MAPASKGALLNIHYYYYYYYYNVRRRWVKETDTHRIIMVAPKSKHMGKFRNTHALHFQFNNSLAKKYDSKLGGGALEFMMKKTLEMQQKTCDSDATSDRYR